MIVDNYLIANALPWLKTTVFFVFSNALSKHKCFLNDAVPVNLKLDFELTSDFFFLFLFFVLNFHGIETIPQASVVLLHFLLYSFYFLFNFVLRR